MTFKPSVKNCEARGCSDLIEVVQYGRRRRVCQLTKHPSGEYRIPGNFSECPREKQEA
ncbi:TPA: hypothetical protein HA338_06290 [Methanosarcina acetivorans]|uniref:Uncharacterized protein n=1 Tax=Methanosarcina acetivorans TaxID=2214 RepID=A0A832W6W2_9EURY|nr:hypothetical protein [Methanosarcina acetivorans]HIH93649.1 hypothetical protein [Methanosarcina acetivorans]